MLYSLSLALKEIESLNVEVARKIIENLLISSDWFRCEKCKKYVSNSIFIQAKKKCLECIIVEIDAAYEKMPFEAVRREILDEGFKVHYNKKNETITATYQDSTVLFKLSKNVLNEIPSNLLTNYDLLQDWIIERHAKKIFRKIRRFVIQIQ
jgi:hypothetical protein